MRPKLRELEALPAPEGIVIRDPYGISEQALVVSPEAWYLASLLDGTREIVDIQAQIFNTAGVLLPREQLDSLVTALEQAFFLETEETTRKLKEAEEAFLAAGSRPMHLAGHSYPGDPESFRAYLGAMRAVAPEVRGGLKGLVMPHLEPAQVPEVYGAALEALAQTAPPARVLIAGVAHRPLGEPMAVLPLNLETPLGPVPVDREALDFLAAQLPFSVTARPLALREEHSLEFPAVFLKGAWQTDFQAIPVVVAGVEDLATLEVLNRAILNTLARFSAFPVASVDLSHVGARFGDPPLDRALYQRAARIDHGYLDSLAALELERAFQDLVLPGNPTRVDAFATMQALKGAFGGQGEVLAYRFAAEPASASGVGAGVVAFR